MRRPHSGRTRGPTKPATKPLSAIYNALPQSESYMKKSIFILACLLSVTRAVNAQTSVSFEINAGELQMAGGGAAVPDGALLQLIASPSGNFAAPTSGSYVGGDNVVLANFAMNSINGTGATQNDFNNFPLSTNSYTVTSGEALLLRFYPSLTLSSEPATPTSGISYGQVRSNTIESGINDPAQAPWVVPPAGNTVDLDYLTVAAGGSYANGANGTGISSYADFTVAVPEPSTGVLFGCGLLGLLGLRMRLRRASASS